MADRRSIRDMPTPHVARRGSEATQGPSPARASVDGLVELSVRLSDWARWGPDSELGALNSITEDKRR